MAKLLPPHHRLGQLVICPRPHTAPVSTDHSVTRRQRGGGSRPPWIHTDRGRQLTADQVEPLIHSRLETIKSAFVALDPDGTGLVSREEFRRVLQTLLSVSQNQLNAVLNEVGERAGASVDYMQFVRRFSRAPTGSRACSSCSRVRRGPHNTSMSLPEIQKHLKDKIGGNLRNVIRVFSLFDSKREGHIQQHELRRILDNYCLHLTDKEFQRLWNHYSPSNTSIISYELFLDKLGFGDSHNLRIAPVCTKLEVSSRGTPPEVRQRKQRPESLSSLTDAPSVLQHRKLQALFYDKMCMNTTPVWRALQAFDTTGSGLVKQHVLRAVLSSFIFPMNPHSFQKLTSCYGVRATGPVRWKHFLGHFLKEEGESTLHTEKTLRQPVPEDNTSHLQAFYPRLKELFSLLDTKEAGHITRADLRYFLERPGGTQPRTGRPQITELLNALDPEHTGVIQLASLERLNPSRSYTAPPSPADTTEPLDAPQGTGHTAEEEKTPDERQTITQCADKPSLASAACRRVDKVLAALKLCDPQHTGKVTQEDLRGVLSCCGMAVSDTHFNKLCKTSSSAPGTSSELVPYTENLGEPLRDEVYTSSSHRTCNHTERHYPSSGQSTMQSVRGQRPSSSLQVGSEHSDILDIVFQRMKSVLERRHSSLTDCIQAVSHSGEGLLSQTDVQKLLEDSWVVLDNEDLHRFTELLGSRDGRMESSVFLLQSEEATARDRRQKDDMKPVLSAEQCLEVMKTRIKIIHGDNLTAFRLMDRKRKGVVDCHDFKRLHSSLGFLCRDVEYQRLLDLIGLHPGGNLNYAEFVDVVENNGKRKQGTACVQEQIHDLLACEVRNKWADMSKVLCQFDVAGQDWVHKQSLRGLLFSYALPMRFDEFDQLWLKYDPHGRGCVAVCDFLEKLGLHHESKLRAQSLKLNQTVRQRSADRQVSPKAAPLECIELIVQQNYEGLRDCLTHLMRRDGTVTVEELLGLLQTYSSSIQREQLVNQLHRLEVPMDDTCDRLACMDFLSVFVHKAERSCECPPACPDAVRQIECLNSLSPDVALARLRELVTASAPHLYKAFSAFDQRGTGTMKVLEFRRVLESFCARLSDKQYRNMLTKLQLDCEHGTVNWKDFLNKFQSQSPLFQCVQSLMPVNEQKKLQYRDILKRFGALGRTEASDHTTNVPSPPSEPRERQDTAGVVPQRTKSAPQCSSRRPVSVGRLGTGSPLGSMERRLRGAVQRCWKDIQRKCTEQDPQKEGSISTACFLDILQSVSISVTREQFERLALKFDITSNGRVSYHDFLRHFLLNLKPAEDKTTQRKLPLPFMPTGHGVLSKDCMEVMLRILDVVRPSWTSIRRCFLMCDRDRTGSVSVQDFRKVLSQFSVTLSSEDFFHLSSYFDASTAGRICYDNFLWAFLH